MQTEFRRSKEIAERVSNVDARILRAGAGNAKREAIEATFPTERREPQNPATSSHRANPVPPPQHHAKAGDKLFSSFVRPLLKYAS